MESTRRSIPPRGFYIWPAVVWVLNVLLFYLRNCGKDGNHQFARCARAVDVVLNREQIDAVALHDLQIIKHVGGIPAEARQLEDEDVIDVVRPILYLYHHFLEGRAAANVFAGLAFVAEYLNHLHAAVVRFALQPFALGIAIYLHFRGYAQTQIATQFLRLFVCHCSPPPFEYFT